jgi:hypothetical protein
LDGSRFAPRFWSWLVALVLGMLLGLWLAGGDRDPSAAELRPHALQGVER